MFGLAFTTPMLLIALAALPAIWWLLRVTPPRPAHEVFPPFRILLLLGRRQETPSTTPWWLIVLRLLLAAALILALSGPIFDPNSHARQFGGPVAIVFDNSWASAPSFDARRKTAEGLINAAGEQDHSVSLFFTANESNDGTFRRAGEALKALAAAKPEPLPAARGRVAAAMVTTFATEKPSEVIFISDGLHSTQDKDFFKELQQLGSARLEVIGTGNRDAVVLADASNSPDKMTFTVRRLTSGGEETFNISARDQQGRILSSTPVTFKPEELQAEGEIGAPFELRNEFARLTIDQHQTAGAVRLLDDSFKRRSVGMISGEAGDRSQPLLSPLYYISRALSPFANLTEAPGTDLATAIPALVKKKPSMLVLADIGRMPASAEKALLDWVSSGGTLVRFAGPRLAAAPSGDPLVPIRLREGERALGGAMSWADPQPLDDFPQTSPFNGLSTPQDVLVSKQVLAEPSEDLQSLTWASLKDGTPLVTAKKIGAGRIVLFHVSAETGWSNLPLSGSFVEMLRRVVQLSHTSASETNTDGRLVLPPYRLLNAQGNLVTEKGLAKPIETGRPVEVSFAHPPGLYGGEDGFQAVNLFGGKSALAPLKVPEAFNATMSGFSGENSLNLKPWLLGFALVLALLDSIAMLFLGGAFARRGATAAAAILIAFAATGFPTDPARADDSRPGDEQLMARLDKTHLAYVLTGEADVDRISERGLAGLTDFLFYRTTLEPGDPVGVDIAKDELSVFPILYWPISATAPMPSDSAISRIDAYMRAGGTVLFDTRDQATSITAALGGVSANTERLRDILAQIDIPPLEPVPHDHVLTKAFYLLKSYPGRYSGSPLWIEAQTQAKADPSRPVHSGDGVTPIMITGNDFAGAWAIDPMGAPLLPLIPPDETQREMAYRTGVNIMMYMLTGNYKADQVHVPALLERLGQ